MLKKIFLFLFTMLFLNYELVFSKDLYPKNYNIDIINYSFEINLNDNDDIVSGITTIDLKIKTDNVKFIRLDLISMREDGKGMVVDNVKYNDTPVTFTHKNDVLLLAVKEINNINTVEVQYHGIPVTGLIIGPNMHGDRTFFSDNWPNKGRNWLPLVDHPYDKATSEFIVIVPSHYQVISNGLLIEEPNLDSNLKRSHWKQSVPISCWLFALGIAEFAVQYVDNFDGKSIQTWVYKQDREKGFYDFAIPTKHTLQFFSDYVGPFAYEKLANVQSNSVSGGMESATAIFYSDVSVTGTRSKRWRNVIIHEVAHQWFGNCVTENDWDHVWLSEGFATYFTLLFREHAYGRDDFVEGLINSRNSVFKFYKKNKDYTIVHDGLDNMKNVLSGYIYQKGAWILHMLRNYIGDVSFNKGIRSYYLNNFNSNTDTESFKKEMEKASNIDLTIFFNQWLYKGGNIILDGNWNYDKKNREIIINLSQVQNDGYYFYMPLELKIFYGNEFLSKLEEIKLTPDLKKFIIKSDKEPNQIILDPSTKLLAEWNFKKQIK